LALSGRFGDTTGRPYLEGRLVFPRLNLRGEVSWLVDTGADESMLMAADALRFGVDYSQLRASPSQSVGIGGAMSSFVEDAILVFTERGTVAYVYYLSLEIAPFSREIQDLPSLLGRDILDRWRMTYEPPARRLTFDVLSADTTLPFGDPA